MKTIEELERELAAMTSLKCALQDSLDSIAQTVGFVPKDEPLAAWIERVVIERDAAQKSCAEMRSVLEIVDNCCCDLQEWDCIDGDRVRHALANAGKDFVSRAELDRANKERDKALAWVEKFKSEAWVSDAEIGVFQENARSLLLRLTQCSSGVIDGKGSDSGWEEFTLAEIGQGVAYVMDQRNEARAELDKLKEQVKPLVEAIRLFVEWCKTPKQVVTPEVIEAQHEALDHAKEMGFE